MNFSSCWMYSLNLFFGFSFFNGLMMKSNCWSNQGPINSKHPLFCRSNFQVIGNHILTSGSLVFFCRMHRSKQQKNMCYIILVGLFGSLKGLTWKNESQNQSYILELPPHPGCQESQPKLSFVTVIVGGNCDRRYISPKHPPTPFHTDS